MGQLVWDASQRRDHATTRDYYDESVRVARHLRDHTLEGRALLRTCYVALYGAHDPRTGLDLARHRRPSDVSKSSASDVEESAHMAARALARGMGTFFKDCEHPESRWSKCPHKYKIRYRSAGGKQTEESGFGTQDKAIARLMEVYNQKKGTPRSQSKAERVQKYGRMRFQEYVEEWKAGQRHLAVSSLRHLDSLLEHHLYPELGSRRMNSFDHKVLVWPPSPTPSTSCARYSSMRIGSASTAIIRWRASSRPSTTLRVR
ncbi:hypothetical protein [Streptomyces sp. NPDC004546]|uniref:hypothetical protein n=1 Tax=Streptomyces sp. NPDC004546 TaxID=3154282 RepID=UPI0033A7C144